MRDTPDGVAGPTVAVAVDAAKLDLRAWRRRLLRRIAISAANAGWIFLCMSGPGHAASPQSNTGGAALETTLETFPGGSLRLLLPGTEPAIPRMPFAYGTIPGFEQPQDNSEGGFASSRFSIDVRQRLPRFLASFERAGQRSGVDWRLLAAMSYQESTWDPHAVSPTGVRGIMMLTLDTAEELEVDRDNPAQSIQGGARYLGRILKHLPAGIHEPDRTNMALAAYNQGIGHLFDARRLAVQTGGSPNHWKDVRATLPLLNEQRWFSKTRHGYAQGEQAVYFVNRVRGYYGMLASITGDGKLHQADIAITGM